MPKICTRLFAFQSPTVRGSGWNATRRPPCSSSWVSVPYRSGKWVEQARKKSPASVCLRFSPLPFGEVGGTLIPGGEGPALIEFQSPTVRGSGWNTSTAKSGMAWIDVSVPYRSGKWVEQGFAAPKGFCRDVSVPYRSGKWVEPGAAAAGIRRSKSACFSPLPFGEVGGTTLRQVQRGTPALVSVPYRSGKWVEHLFVAAADRAAGGFSPLPFGEVGGTLAPEFGKRRRYLFQSPTVRGSGWNSALHSTAAEGTAGFSPLPFGEVGGTWSGCGRHGRTIRFSPLPFGEVGGTATALKRPCNFSGCFSPLPFGEVGGTSAVPPPCCRRSVSVPYRSGKWVELRTTHHPERIKPLFQSPTVRGSGWNCVFRIRAQQVLQDAQFQSPTVRGSGWNSASGDGEHPPQRTFQSPTVRGSGWNGGRWRGSGGGSGVSVPYRSGKWVEHATAAQVEGIEKLFQSPTVRGSGWNAGRDQNHAPGGLPSFSPLPFGEVGGTRSRPSQSPPHSLVSVPYRSGKWVEPPPGADAVFPGVHRFSPLPFGEVGGTKTDCRLPAIGASCFSPLPFGEVGGTAPQPQPAPLDRCFSPLPFGEVGGTYAAPTTNITERAFQSPTVRGSGWNATYSFWPGVSTPVSVPYRSGKWVELHGLPAGPDGDGVSVPYRSGKWVEPALWQAMVHVITKFQSPTVRGSGWNGGRPDCRRVCPAVSVPYRSGKWVELRVPEKSFTSSVLRFQSPTVRGSGWNPPIAQPSGGCP